MHKYSYKIFIQENKLDNYHWEYFFNTIFEYGKNFDFEVVFDGSEIDFYLFHKKDLSHLSSSISPFILKPETKRLETETLKSYSLSLKLNKSKNILDLKENEEIKKGKTLKKIIWSFYDLFSAHLCKLQFYFEDLEGKLYKTNKFFFKVPLYLLKIDFTKSIKYKKSSVPVYLKIESIINSFSNNESDGFLEIIGFPYLSSPMYFPLKNFEFNKHSLIVGQTGVGKSKFIELFVKELKRQGLQDEYSIIIIDPHAALYENFNPTDFIDIDFKDRSCNLFFRQSEPKIATELTILLFKTLLKDQFNAKIERVLKYALYVLFSSGAMSLASLKRFLTELEYRKEILKLKVNFENIIQFFDTEFVELQTKFYEIAIMPILVLIDELGFLPIFDEKESFSLKKITEENFLTCFSLNRIFLGDKATKLIAGFITQQIFLLSQSRSLSKKIILIIDEVSIVENEALISILSEARKFNLSLFLSQQYLSQINPELLKAVLSNVYNYFLFKVAEEDAKLLGKNLQMEFSDEILKSTKEKGGDEEGLKIKLMTSLNPRECLIRVFSHNKFQPCFKAKTFDI